jgi:hypothetical protein
MRRPAVSVVMPFAGDGIAALGALKALHTLETRAGDELILADNAGVVPADPGITVVRATEERSPAHARNAGAEIASGDWILFLDADCNPPAGLLDAYFAEPVADDVGALAGEVRPAPGAESVAERYGAQRSFLSQRAHLAHPFRPRAVAANLLVRRVAFEQIGGFYEGVRAAEDTDFSWRLQEGGWRLELRPGAAVEHRYRATVGDLRRQWRGYAAGRAWLARRYAGFVPEPAVRRALRRLGRRRELAAPGQRVESTGPPPGLIDRGRYLALDAVLSAEELAGLVLSNRPRSMRSAGPVQAVLLAERFPVAGDPLVELARTLGGVRVEAAARPREIDPAAMRELAIAYREDDGTVARLVAAARLLARHPVRSVRDLVLLRSPGQPGLGALAPAVVRLEHEPHARVLALGAGSGRAVAERIARLAGRRLDEPPRRGRRES